MKAFLITGLFGAVLLAAGAAQAAPLSAEQILGRFNAVILGDFTTGHDVEGRLVVGGDLTGGATFYNQPRGGSIAGYGAVNVRGDVAPGTYNVNNGGSVVVGGNNAGHFNLNGGGTLSTGTANITLSDFVTPLSALVGKLTALAANSTVLAADPNNVAFNAVPDASGLAVFSTNTAVLESARNLVVNLNGADTVVVNVSGTRFNDTANFNAGFDVNTRVIWNFFEATSLHFGFWHGSVLAMNAAVSNFTPIEGTLVAASFNGGGELHDYGFRGRLPSDPVAVPEPGTLGLMAMGLAGLAVARRRRA
jgi:choice-of-anchor A domain-containing protein